MISQDDTDLGYVDDLSAIQQSEILADLFCISSYYLGQVAGVKPRPEPAGLLKALVPPVSCEYNESLHQVIGQCIHCF
jgi:hypothetical protein